MTEEEMDIEALIQSHEVTAGQLPYVESGEHAKELQEFKSFTAENEGINQSDFSNRLPNALQQTRGAGVKVALLDTGVDPGHPCLAPAIRAYEDFTGDGLQDVNGHGTHCAGVIAARPNDAGCIGAAPECDLLVGKVISNDGYGDFAGIAEGVDWAVDKGAHIISMSVTGLSSSPLLYRSIAYALAKGVHVICAAGNSGNQLKNGIGYPGKYGGVITVASHDRCGNASGFTSRRGEIDFMGPGQRIWSTYKGASYQELSGTSMAASYIAGVSALIVSKHLKHPGVETPVFNCEDLRTQLKAMAKRTGRVDGARAQGSTNVVPFNFS